MTNKRKEMFKSQMKRQELDAIWDTVIRRIERRQSMAAKEILDEVQVLPEQRRELMRFINCFFDALERRGYVMESMHGAANRVTPFNACVVLPSALEVAAHENSGID